MFNRLISSSISPNVERDDVYCAVRALSTPWKWKAGHALEMVKVWFEEKYPEEKVFLFNSGRSALVALLEAFGIGKGDEVIIQSFTCVAVADPILWVGAKPIYVDIDKDYNIDAKQLEKSISLKTKALIVQHTFGIPAKIELITKIAQKHKLYLFEDCSHSLGVKINGKQAGSLGDAAFFSFGRDKVISSVFGGAAIVHQKHQPHTDRMDKIQSDLPYPGFFWIFQQLIHPIAFSIILPLYTLQIGKILLVLLQKVGLLSKPVTKKELVGEKPAYYPQKYPNALAQLLINQLKKLENYNTRRRKIVTLYIQKLKKYYRFTFPEFNADGVYLRFPLLCKDSSFLVTAARKKNIMLGTWYSHVIDPLGVDFRKVGYEKGQCRVAESMAEQCVNLPTYPRMRDKDVYRVIKTLEDYGNSRNY